ncbi:unnamed protein product, partial [marine sediment metagenome]
YYWGNSGSDGARGVTCMNSNLYVTGYFRDTVDFKPGPFFEEHTAVAQHDVYLSKFDGYGDHLWTATWGGSCESYYQDVGTDVAVNSDGDVLVVGYFQGSADFNPDPVGENILSSWGSTDAFINYLRSDGTYIGAGVWGGTGYDGALDLSVDSSNNVYVTGSFEGYSDFNPFGGVLYKNSNGESDAYLSKFHTETTFLVWDGASTWGGAEDDSGSGVGVYDRGIYVTGSFEDTVDFDPGGGTEERTSVNWKKDIF